MLGCALPTASNAILQLGDINFKSKVLINATGPWIDQVLKNIADLSEWHSDVFLKKIGKVYVLKWTQLDFHYYLFCIINFQK